MNYSAVVAERATKIRASLNMCAAFEIGSIHIASVIIHIIV